MFFFASACESTKVLIRLPRRLQLKIKKEVMMPILNAETEFLDQLSSTTSSTILSSEVPDCSRILTTSPAQTSFQSFTRDHNQAQETTFVEAHYGIKMIIHYMKCYFHL